MGIMDVLAELDDPETDISLPEEPEAAEEPSPEIRPVIIDVQTVPDTIPEEFPVPSRKSRGLRPEWILGIIAAAAAILPQVRASYKASSSTIPPREVFTNIRPGFALLRISVFISPSVSELYGICTLT